MQNENEMLVVYLFVILFVLRFGRCHRQRKRNAKRFSLCELFSFSFLCSFVQPQITLGSFVCECVCDCRWVHRINVVTKKSNLETNLKLRFKLCACSTMLTDCARDNILQTESQNDIENVPICVFFFSSSFCIFFYFALSTKEATKIHVFFLSSKWEENNVCVCEIFYFKICFRLFCRLNQIVENEMELFDYGHVRTVAWYHMLRHVERNLWCLYFWHNILVLMKRTVLPLNTCV